MKKIIAILVLLATLTAAGCEMHLTGSGDSNYGVYGGNYGAVEGHIFAGECIACSAFVALNGPSSWCTRSDSLGFYRISQPPGKYEICAYYEGYEYFEDSVTISYKATITLDIYLIEDTTTL